LQHTATLAQHNRTYYNTYVCRASSSWSPLQHSATLCATHNNTLQHTIYQAFSCSLPLQHATTRCTTNYNTLLHQISQAFSSSRPYLRLRPCYVFCNTLQPTATHCNPLHDSAHHCVPQLRTCRLFARLVRSVCCSVLQCVACVCRARYSFSMGSGLPFT